MLTSPISCAPGVSRFLLTKSEQSTATSVSSAITMISSQTVGPLRETWGDFPAYVDRAGGTYCQ
jgi:hypothetical protein